MPAAGKEGGTENQTPVSAVKKMGRNSKRLRIYPAVGYQRKAFEVGKGVASALRHEQTLFDNRLMDVNGWVTLEDLVRVIPACHREGVRSVEELKGLLEQDEIQDDKRRVEFREAWDRRNQKMMVCLLHEALGWV